MPCRIRPLSNRNACAVRQAAASIVATLQRPSKFPLPGHVGASIRDSAARHGSLRLERRNEWALLLRARDLPLAEKLAHQTTVASFLTTRLDPLEFEIPAAE
jgi:hypothetical protein